MTAGVRDNAAAWNQLLRNLRSARGAVVKVGVMSGDGARSEGSLTNAEIAAVHEFGSPEKRIPRRPFLSAAYEENRAAIMKLKKRLVKKMISGQFTPAQALGILGEYHTAQVRRKLTKGPWAPNSARTIALKGSSKPLIDTGQLRVAINYEVEM